MWVTLNVYQNEYITFELRAVMSIAYPYDYFTTRLGIKTIAFCITVTSVIGLIRLSSRASAPNQRTATSNQSGCASGNSSFKS